MFDLSFYEGKKVLITGHTGFKGSWLTKILTDAGAEVTGYSRCSEKECPLFERAGLEKRITHIKGDVRDLEHMKEVFQMVQPEIVFHLAAQPIVRESYADPVYTYETNVLGTLNIMECSRLFSCVKSVLNVTTDKVYQNKEWCWGYREDEPLDGFDPYSNSKSCSELITHCYKNSFFQEGKTTVSTARAGNVIGGGDFARDRIIPDCVRAMEKHRKIAVRNPYSIRPYQHVLEPLFAYLMIAAEQYRDPAKQGYYNVGPDECDCISTGVLVQKFCDCWGDEAQWENLSEANAPHEANFLKLDCSRLKSTFGWKPTWHMDTAVEMVCRFYKAWFQKEDIGTEMEYEIRRFVKDRENG